MSSKLLFDFDVNKDSNTIHIKREFAANIHQVWDSWTKVELLEQWWAPRPYHVETISMNFVPKGIWHYAMVSPEGEKHFCKAYYDMIEVLNRFTYRDAFCNADGVDSTDMPSTQWDNTFTTQHENLTIVEILLSYDSVEALERIISLGFKEGFTMAIDQLDELLTQIK